MFTCDLIQQSSRFKCGLIFRWSLKGRIMWGDALENAGSEESPRELKWANFFTLQQFQVCQLPVFLPDQASNCGPKLSNYYPYSGSHRSLKVRSVLKRPFAAKVTGDDRYRQNKRPLFLQHFTFKIIYSYILILDITRPVNSHLANIILYSKE